MQTIDDIDFQKIWENARKARSWASKKPADWDKKAPSFASRNRTGPFIDRIMERLPLQPAHSVLDIGCGPGTLALPIAHKVAAVTALDYSSQMLSVLLHQAEEENISNITTVQCSWEDDWRQAGIGPHDIVLASRSLNLEDLTGALSKANQYARKYVFLIDRVTPTPFEPQVFEAIGRPFESGPDYIYTLNILYQLGIQANVEMVQLERTITFASLEDTLGSFRWMLKNLSDQEDKLLQEYIDKKAIIAGDGSVIIERDHPPKWAVIWWKKETAQ